MVVKYLECPMCRQPMVDLSNDPRFVNHNPDGDSSKSSRSRRDVPPPGSSFDRPVSSGMERGLPKPKRKQKEIAQNNAKNVNFKEKEESKGTGKNKFWVRGPRRKYR